MTLSTGGYAMPKRRAPGYSRASVRNSFGKVREHAERWVTRPPVKGRGKGKPRARGAVLGRAGAVACHSPRCPIMEVCRPW